MLINPWLNVLLLTEPMHDNGTQTIKAEVVEPIPEPQEMCREEANTSSTHSPSPRTVYTFSDGKVSVCVREKKKEKERDTCFGIPLDLITCLPQSLLWGCVVFCSSFLVFSNWLWIFCPSRHFNQSIYCAVSQLCSLADIHPVFTLIPSFSDSDQAWRAKAN